MPRRRRSILFPLDEEEHVFLRARLDTEGRQVVGFAIQLEVVTDEERQIVMRFDTAHGYVHQHVFEPGREESRRLRFRDWGQAYNYCYEYVKRNWELAVARYLRGES